MARLSRPFSGFEWMVAARYLRAKRQESFISVISGFSLEKNFWVWGVCHWQDGDSSI